MPPRCISSAVAARLPLLLAIAALTACGGRGIEAGSGASGSTTPTVTTGGSDCSATRLKQNVLDTAREWYLFPELLPPSVDVAQYASPSELLESITAAARAQGRDREFSYVIGIAAENAVLQGATVGFGFTLVERSGPARIFVGQVIEGSVAAEAGLVRGDEVLALGDSAANLRTSAEVLAAPGGVDEALGPASAGVTRVLRWRARDGSVTERSLTKRAFELVAVPPDSVRVFTTGSGLRVGHLVLRAFVADPSASGQAADLAALRSAFASFAAQNVTNLVIDLRYNGGGLVSIAELLLNLIAGDQAGQVSYATRLNARQIERQETRRLARLPQTLATMRVAFLTSSRSASASELVINSAAPYVRTAVIGGRSFGKPVGQFAFDVPACDFRLRLVSFKSVNRNDDGDYFAGLPYEGITRLGATSCAAEDDLTRALGDPQERMLAEALAWLGSPEGRCSAGAIASADAAPSASSGEPIPAAKSTLGETQSRAAPLRGLHEMLPGTY